MNETIIIGFKRAGCIKKQDCISLIKSADITKKDQSRLLYWMSYNIASQPQIMIEIASIIKFNMI